jgi:tetratricopeptide (TPR) repeat protein
MLQPHRDAITVPSPAPDVVPERIEDVETALTWFAAERQVLLGATAMACRWEFDAHAWRLAWGMSDLLARQAHWQDHYESHGVALVAANRLADPAAIAYVHRGLGIGARSLGRHDEAHSHSREALRRFTEIRDRAGQAITHMNLARLAEVQGRLDESLRQAKHAFELYRADGHRVGLARARNAVGWCYARLGEHRRALTWCQRAYAELQRAGDREGAAYALDSIAYLHHHLGDHETAVLRYQEVVELNRDIGDRYNEADALNLLGDAHLVAGNAVDARRAWERALSIFDALGHPDAEQIRTKLGGDSRP